MGQSENLGVEFYFGKRNLGQFWFDLLTIPNVKNKKKGKNNEREEKETKAMENGHFHQRPLSSKTIFIRKNEERGWSM